MMDSSITIVGLGLMGGSLALALRPQLRYLVVVDKEIDTLQAARAFANEVTPDFELGVRQADLVILATPLRSILHLLTELSRLRPDGLMVMDLGSTKVEVCRAMEALPASFMAIGGHPMCGKETSTFSAAVPDLYQSQTFVLCRNARTQPDLEAVALEIIRLIGAHPLFLPADVHDGLVAATSHLPYLAAATLMRSVTAFGDPRTWQVSASGLRDTTRLAGSDPAMMSDILLTNRSEVLAQLVGYQNELAALIELLQLADDQALTQWLAQVQRQHQIYRQHKGAGAGGGG